jgi:hypothetical protein
MRKALKAARKFVTQTLKGERNYGGKAVYTKRTQSHFNIQVEART